MLVIVIGAWATTAPDESTTDPVNAPNCPWARIKPGKSRQTTIGSRTLLKLRMEELLWQNCPLTDAQRPSRRNRGVAVAACIYTGRRNPERLRDVFGLY